MGVYLSQPCTTKNINQGVGAKMNFCSAEMQGWRKSMEDAAIHTLDIGDGNSLFAVFDGHGGFEVSRYVQRIFVNELINLAQYKEKKYQIALDIVFRKVDQKISGPQGSKQLKKLREDTESYEQVYLGTGCTANVVLVTPTHYYVANAGDSRSVLCRGGIAIDLSFDHKPQNQQQQARIRKAGGHIAMGRVNGGLNLSRSFGDFNYKKNTSLGYAQQMITCKPDIKKQQRKQEDQFIIVGCDGIWERYVQNSQGLIDIIKLQTIKYKNNNKKIMQDLLDGLLAKQTTSGIGCDNMSAILIRLQ